MLAVPCAQQRCTSLRQSTAWIEKRGVEERRQIKQDSCEQMNRKRMHLSQTKDIHFLLRSQHIEKVISNTRTNPSGQWLFQINTVIHAPVDLSPRCDLRVCRASCGVFLLKQLMWFQHRMNRWRHFYLPLVSTEHCSES